MKIKQLIALLQSHPNQEAQITITANPSINGEDEDMDITLYQIAVFNLDDFYNDTIELFAYNEEIITYNEAPYGND